MTTVHLPAARTVPGQAEHSTGDALAAWERDVLHKLRLLRQTGKPAILYVTDSGAILVFRGEPAGRIAP
jgi:hypothetical protein